MPRPKEYFCPTCHLAFLDFGKLWRHCKVLNHSRPRPPAKVKRPWRWDYGEQRLIWLTEEADKPTGSEADPSGPGVAKRE